MGEKHTPWTPRSRQYSAKEMPNPSLHFGIVYFCHHLLQFPVPVERCQTRGACTVCPTQLPYPAPPLPHPHHLTAQLEAAQAHGCNGLLPAQGSHCECGIVFLRHLRHSYFSLSLVGSQSSFVRFPTKVYGGFFSSLENPAHSEGCL